MQKIFVLADDLTGAAEIGGAALGYGLSVQIVFNLDAATEFAADVLVLDSNSRSMDQNHAYQHINKLLLGHDFSAYAFVYKKVDSLLRGPVLSEIKACLNIFDLDKSVLVPANPSRGRLIQKGKYYIHGVPVSKTEFRKDALHPRKTDEVMGMFNKTDSMVEPGSHLTNTSEGKISVPNISTEKDIRDIASQIPGAGVLPAGANDFFQALLELRMKLVPIVQSPDNFVESSGAKFFVTGSHSISSRKAITILRENNYEYFPLPESAITDGIVFGEWISEVGKSVLLERNTVISGPVEKIKDKNAAKRITALLVDAARMVTRRAKFTGHLFVDGGETASLFFRTMDWNQLKVEKVHDDGVVTLKPENEETHVTIKPGSYEWPEELMT